MILAKQYESVLKSRGVLLSDCKEISGPNFLKENNSFGQGSIRNLLIHIGNIYQFWIGKNALKEDVVFTSMMK